MNTFTRDHLQFQLLLGLVTLHLGRITGLQNAEIADRPCGNTSFCGDFTSQLFLVNPTAIKVNRFIPKPTA